MTARSVVLSVLLGAHPAWATASELLRLTADFGLRESTVRVALTRLVNSGDLVRSADGYRLSDRLLARQRRQDDAMRPQLKPWDGRWIVLVITTVGTDARTRASMRTILQQRRFGELREGVWLRPDNLAAELPEAITDRVRVLRACDDAAGELARQLWDLPGWSRTASRLLDQMSTATDTRGRFIAAAGMVRHLLTDPVLPAELLPPDWPADSLRDSYFRFADDLAARRHDNQLVEA
jgi:phenylacetic acid degradation operon negative regulatory protein